MKKIFLIFISFLLSSLVFTQVSASDITAKNKLFKELAITTTQVEKDYSKKYNTTLDLYFNKIRYYKKRNELLTLEKKLEPVISKYNKKTYLNINERKKFNLLKNIYYRSKVLSLYYVK